MTNKEIHVFFFRWNMTAKNRRIRKEKRKMKRKGPFFGNGLFLLGFQSKELQESLTQNDKIREALCVIKMVTKQERG